MANARLTGQVVSGRGEGASFTQVDWAKRLFVEELGIDPFPGTMNIRLDADQLGRWQSLRRLPGVALPSPNAKWCDARGYSVRVGDRFPGAIIVPEVPGYPQDQVELIAALPLRRELGLKDGDRLEVSPLRPLHVAAVIFDIDGTLVDSIPALREVAQRAAPELPISMDLVRRALNEQVSFWELVVPPETPDRGECIEALHSRASALWPEVLRSHARAFEGISATLDGIAARGLRLGLYTGSRQGSFEPLRRAGVMDRFASFVTRSDVERGKPHPEGLWKCAEQLGVEPERAVYVGDTATDIEAARGAGMAAIGVLTGAGDSAVLSKAGPDWLVSSHARLGAILEAA